MVEKVPLHHADPVLGGDTPAELRHQAVDDLFTAFELMLIDERPADQVQVAVSEVSEEEMLLRRKLRGQLISESRDQLVHPG